VCEWEGCVEEGAFPAPASPNRLRERRWFCLEHVREYNRAWNYYANMSFEEIEWQRRRDTVWQRPTWPFSRGSTATSSPCGTGDSGRGRAHMPISPAEKCAATTLGLRIPYTKDSLKRCFRDLAKDAHPDLNPGQPNAEERFKQLREAYMTLLRTCTK